MSSVMENRTAVFTGHPQVVEVLRAGAWRVGELLGWRHDGSGACQMWVRVVVDGVEQTTWAALAAVRLPEPASVAAHPVTQVMAAQPAIPPGGAPAADPEVAASEPLVRDSREGRSVTTRTGGRRRAPEGDEVRTATAASVAVNPSGRHRAPATASGPVVGRHRAVDADLVAVVEGAPDVPGGDAGARARAIPAVRSAPAEEVRPLRRVWAPPAEPEPEPLTRPMRLGDQVPHSRRPRVGDPLSA